MKDFFFLYLFVLTFWVQAQGTQANFFNKNFQIDTSYIQDLSDKLVVRGFSKSKTNSLDIVNTITNEQLIYKPNSSSSLGGGFNYNWLGVDISVQLPGTDKEHQKYGETNSFDFQANTYLRKFAVDLSYVRYKGYYLEDANDPKNGDTIIKHQGLRTHSLGLGVNYIFNNKKFSYRAAYLQNERQKKSSGTFFSGGFISLTGLESNKGLIPLHYVKLYPEIANLTRINSWQVGGQGGYAHTFVLKSFYLTMSLGGGLGVENKKFITKDSRTLISEFGLAPRYQLRGAFGYNSNDLSFGIQGVKDGVFIGGTGKNDLIYNFGSWRLFVAYRLTAPKPLHFLKEINPFKKRG